MIGIVMHLQLKVHPDEENEKKKRWVKKGDKTEQISKDMVRR